VYKMLKLQDHIIETTASILTKCCVTIKTTVYLLFMDLLVLLIHDPLLLSFSASGNCVYGRMHFIWGVIAPNRTSPIKARVQKACVFL